MKEKALQYLRTALGNPSADFRDGQWECIESLLSRQRLLVVERTGWGKSMVYFLATRLLRDRGAGTTLLISPLLSLMRNQMAAAARIGIKAVTINSTNADDWEAIGEQVRKNEVDILFVSPERLANDKFREEVLNHIASRVGLFVVDEAHCISDWGHDFRTDYRRIVRVLQLLPANIPVLATTATANDRVVKDVMHQLGDKITLVRGPLIRESLKLQNITMNSPADRMAWLASTIPGLPGSGIVYTLTQRDAERVAEWLRNNGIKAEAYHASVEGDEGDLSRREFLEQKLLNNEIKALVATVALGMGFDKPDLGFVIHFQRPASVVHYYQQVGRAGRAVAEAYGILLCGEEDDSIADYFIRSAFPPQKHVAAVLGELEKADGGLSINELESKLNLRYGQLEKTLKFLSVESPSPVAKIKSKWNATATTRSYQINQEYVAAIEAIRRAEQKQMQAYMSHNGCLMEFLARTLDDPAADACGKCAGCAGTRLLDTSVNHDLVNQAALFLKRSFQPIRPRKRWPAGQPLAGYGLTGMITEELAAREGRALCLWRDAGWGRLVAEGKYTHGRFDDELVQACRAMLEPWKPDPVPLWVTCIPSLKHPELVPDFALRLATALELPFRPVIRKVKDNPPQKTMENKFQQAKNLDGVFEVANDPLLSSPCLLVDDMIDSGWTFTVAAALLRRAGCPAVFPMALTLNSPQMD
jgi:ATP-dependent DNA helicase RecQ